MSVCSLITIPMPFGVPMTLQTFAIPFAAVVLGARNGTLAAVVYVLLGLLGLPVFAGGAAGAGVVFGPTGGFILSFPLMALLAGLGARGKGWLKLALGLVFGVVLNFLCGMCMYAAVTGNSMSAAFGACVAPFLPAAAVKAVLAGFLGVKVKKAVKQSNK